MAPDLMLILLQFVVSVNHTHMFGLLDNFMWREASPFVKLHSLCYKVHTVRKRKTWEEALEFCRENHQDLASVASDTEMMLMQRELQKQEKTTEHVWVGLRFLAGEWFWVDGQPLEYEAWGPNEQTQCPRMGCGALRVTGTCGDMCDSVIQAGNVEEWNMVDCSERLHFLCY
uniref:C-type lectin domain-containing protein n=1 Tax=Neogobius melanostomus TaxID=47308 RepID=A0A8C6U4T3_9GOBI